MQLWSDAYVDSVTPRYILSVFRSCRISPFDPQCCVEHCPPKRIQQQNLPACPANHAHINDASQNSLQKFFPSAAPSQVSTKSDAPTQCSGSAINAATRDDPWLLRLGGFVTAQDFLDKVNEKENGAAAKPAPKRRSRRVGEPLRRIDRPAAECTAKRGPHTALKPKVEKRRRDDDPGQEAAPAPDMPSLPPTKWMVQEIRLICMLASKVVVNVFGLKSVCQRGRPKQTDAK